MYIGMERPKGENEGMDDKKKQHEEDALDEALRESFPASDPIAVHAQVTPPDPTPRSRHKARRRKRPSAKKAKKRASPKTRSRKKAGKKKPARRAAAKKNRSTR